MNYYMKLPFLNIKIKLTTEKIIIKVNKKEINTDVLLNFSAIMKNGKEL